MDLKERLREARRSSPLYPGGIPPEKAERIREMIKQGTSKKSLCMVLGINYQELKSVTR